MDRSPQPALRTGRAVFPAHGQAQESRGGATIQQQRGTRSHEGQGVRRVQPF